jgi:ABC-type multidrug transport system ATPase subunit
MRIEIPLYPPIVTHNVHIELEPDKPFVLVSGPNGCGKSTLIQLAIGLLEGNGRSAIIIGENIYYPSENRGLIRYLPQDPENGLFARMSVRDNLRLLRDLLNIPKKYELKGPNINYDKIPAWLISVGQQKLMLLQAILGSIDGRKDPNIPIIVFLDEPFAGLDSSTRQIVFDLLVKHANKESRSNNLFFLLVDHGIISAVHPSPTRTEAIRDKIEFSFTPAESIKLVK